VSLLADIVSWILLLAGGGLVVVGSLGLVRFPDLFTRMHSVSITDTLGAGLMMSGLLLQSPDWPVAVRLILITAFLLLTSPTATHALAKAALHGGLRPLGRDVGTEDPSSKS
jgi:multicomponent Na+:H+ antiporter subunit G